MKDYTKGFTVNGEPMLFIGGEVHNSASSTLFAMEKIWIKAKELNLNALLLPVSWELIEPQEGEFDFSLVDGLITEARKNGLKLGLLWFGSFKNAQCFYAPEWVKRDLNRFKRAEIKKGCNRTNLENFHGMSYSNLSALCEETKLADGKAFAALMKHLKEFDGEENTVVMVQAENETGIQGAAREHSDYADELFNGNAPQDFVSYMKANVETMKQPIKSSVENGAACGSWSEVFGGAAEEIFQAYYTAKFVGYVAECGKKQYDLPIAVNAWLDKGEAAGQFPSGGPVAHAMEIWKFCAPEIDVFAPDIYVREFLETCEDYTRLGNPLFIPETAMHSHVAPRLVYTVGKFHSIGFSPFGIEDMGEPFDAVQSYLFGVDTKDPLLVTPQNTEEYAAYVKMLRDLTPMLVKGYGTDRLQATISERPKEDMLIFDKFGFKTLYELPMIARKDGVALILQKEEDEFYIIINGALLAYFSTDRAKPNVDVISLEEGTFVDGKWRANIRLNGDEATIMRFEKPTLLRLKLFAYN